MYAWPSSGLPDDPVIPTVIAAADMLARDVSQTVAIVDLIGSEDARSRARAIYSAAKAVSEIYQERSRSPGAEDRKAAREPFDAAGADVLCNAFREAIDAFAGAVRPEFGTGQSAAARPSRMVIRRKRRQEPSQIPAAEQ